MKERFLSASAVMLFITRQTLGGEEILLQLRCGTGYRDGYYDLCAAGHVEDGESLTEAMRREAREELGIGIDEGELRFVCLIHKRSGGESYFNAYFKAEEYAGEPKICEPEKCGELRWFKIDELPEMLVEDRRLAIKYYQSGVSFGEYGFNERKTNE